VIGSWLWRAPVRFVRRVSSKLGLWLVVAAALGATVEFSNLDIEAQLRELGADARLTWAALILAAVILPVAVAQIVGWDRRLWHWLANVTAFERPHQITKFWVIDGDTIDDVGRNVRYRLANIDAPETGDSAKCFREQERGEAAKWAAIKLLRDAKLVSVRRTWRWDRYGRRIVFILADGDDLGDFLVRRGLARPWRGKREKWCGPRGGLSKIAAAHGAPHVCETCRDWR
jgi:hypothetical protein